MKSKSLNSITTYEFRGPKAGPALLFFGAVHGNETCGTKAIERMIQHMNSGKIKLLKGRVCFVPVANPLAYEQNVRFVKENLNRIFKRTRNPRSNEACLANELCDIVDRCDVFLDIHSTTAKGKPFIYLDFATATNRRYAKSLGPAIAVTGWAELYKKLGPRHASFETTAYAAKQGKDCLLIECGQHQEAAAVTVAYKAIFNTLRHYGVVRGKAPPRSFLEVKMTAGYFRPHADSRLAKNWKHLDKIRKGDPLIIEAGGKLIKAPYDAVIIMPKATAGVGEDWLYLGKIAKN